MEKEDYMQYVRKLRILFISLLFCGVAVSLLFNEFSVDSILDGVVAGSMMILVVAMVLIAISIVYWLASTSFSLSTQ